VGDPHSEIVRRALIGLLGNADAVLHATETGSARIGANPAASGHQV
jgi:hypothetical protein